MYNTCKFHCFHVHCCVQVVKKYNKYEKERQELIRGVYSGYACTGDLYSACVCLCLCGYSTYLDACVCWGHVCVQECKYSVLVHTPIPRIKHNPTYILYVRTYVCMYVRTYTSIGNVCTYVRTYVQWNHSIEDTTGTQQAVLYREVSLIQRQICTLLYVVGTADSVLIREVIFSLRLTLCRVCPHRADPPEEAQSHALCELKHSL